MGVVAFPRTPAPAHDAVLLRPFGAVARDLDVDFTGARVAITDAVLESCTEPRIERCDQLPISVRIRALLRLAAIEAPAVELVIACACGELLELALPLAEIARDPDRVPAEVDVAGRRVRVPTGEDQRRFATFAGDPQRARLAMVRSLAGDPAIATEEADAIEAALDATDPLVGFFVRAECPACARSLCHDVDLESLAHRRLAGAQARLIDAIHRLASAYHWTEHDVLALPPARRARYLELVERSRGAS